MGDTRLALNESLSCYWSLQQSEDPQVKDRDWRMTLMVFHTFAWQLPMIKCRIIT
jgi:hypothetical protein